MSRFPLLDMICHYYHLKSLSIIFISLMHASPQLEV